MILHYFRETDTLEIRLSEPLDTDGERVRSVRVLPCVQALVTVPPSEPPPGFKVTDPEKWAGNVMLHRLRITDVCLHATGDHPEDLCTLWRNLGDLLTDLDKLAEHWQDNGAPKQGFDLTALLHRHTGRLGKLDNTIEGVDKPRDHDI